ncbi:hypothetical protein GTY87_20395 [Streptomyces sp. SID7813]|uniref:Uncharacterized protein n=1 Tax=Streptomyces coelicolor (strain ATCC BAA-471 / A3(2) / M145) TaxID=100226 RepID=Q93J14_STRCO|nr:hypothetical protein [Streptomyces sp. SID7813]QFI43986.1 hypothetical protein FQ762_20575 [Streptomyces coelicolor A3(2)]CAC44718.1 hypothetical protein [Streptomyces coelicolor A3(2)]
MLSHAGQPQDTPTDRRQRNEHLAVIVDTQTVSYVLKGSSIAGGDLSGFSVTSTVAHEFLRVRDVATREAR